MKEELLDSKNENVKVDQNFETAIENYLISIVAAEKEGYQSSLQPFAVREHEIRAKVSEAFHFFQKSFAQGYRTLIEELIHEMEISKSEENLLALVEVDPEKLKIFGDTEALIKALEEGKSIYELLGYTEKSLNVFYHAVRHLLENKEFERARDVCYFLVTIAPGVSQFWVSLGQCDANLKAYESAFYELSKAIEVDPTEVNAYSNIIDLLQETHEFDKATGLCDAGVQFALEHREESWAEILRARLEEKKNEIQISFRNLQNRAA